MELVIMGLMAIASIFAAGFGIRAYRIEAAELARAEIARAATKAAFVAHYKAQLEAVKAARKG